MINLQYVNDVAVQTAKQNKLDNNFKFSRIAQSLLKDKRYRSIFILEYNNAYGKRIL